MRQNYDDIISKVLQSEGGYTNDPQDPGGPTNFGITIHDYRAYIDRNGTAEDVKEMTVAQAKEIYKTKYWDAVRGDSLPSGVDYSVFDYGVNSGVSRALRVYRQVKTDDDTATINAINDERLAFLKSLRTWSRFGKGWGARVVSVRAHSLQLSKNPVSSPDLPNLSDIDNQVSSASAIFTTIKTFFKENFKTNIAVGAGSVAAMFTKDWPYILLGVLIVAGLAWLAFEIYERKFKNG